MRTLDTVLRELDAGDLPALVYFERIAAANLRHFLELTSDVPRRRCLYAVKASTFPFLMHVFRRHGIAGFDASSATEALFVARVMRWRAPLYVTAPAISAPDVATIRDAAPACVHVDSLASLERLLDLAPDLPIGIRVNPGHGFAHLPMHDAGTPHSRLGVPLDHLADAWAICARAGRRTIGLHAHLTCEAENFDPQITFLRGLDERLRALPPGMTIAHIDLGGGIAAPGWDFEADQLIPSAVSTRSCAELAAAARDVMRNHGDRLADAFAFLFEPGDFLVCSAAAIVTGTVEQRTSASGVAHLIVDTNVNHFPNLLQSQTVPAIVWPPDAPGGDAFVLSGNSCLAGDQLTTVRIGGEPPSRVVFGGRGSYEYVQYNFFNGRFRPTVFSCDEAGTLQRLKRDSFDDLTFYWRETPDAFPEPYQGFNEFERVAQEEIARAYYDPQLRQISAFEQDPAVLPTPAGCLRAVREGFERYATTYGRSLGLPEVRERIAEYERSVAPAAGFTRDHAVVTLGATNAIWLVLSAMLRGGSKRLLIHCPNYFQYSLCASRLGIPWRHVHQPRPAALPPELEVPPELFVPSVDDLMRSIDVTDGLGAVVLSDPGLPYGRRAEPGALQRLAARAREESWLLIVDETLGDLTFAGPEDDWRWLEPDHPVIRIKSVSKTLGLSGARSGYLCLTEAARVIDRRDACRDFLALADSAYATPVSAMQPLLVAMLGVLDGHRRGVVDDDVARLRENCRTLGRHAARVGELLRQHGIHYVAPHAGANLMIALQALRDCRTESFPFFRRLVREHGMFIELGGLFTQNPRAPYTLARIGLGRPLGEIERDLTDFCRTYRAVAAEVTA